MHILLISTNTFTEPIPILPIGAAYVSKALKDAGHQVSFLDLAWVKKEELGEVVKKTIKETSPDLVGLSIRNTDDYIEDPPKLLLPLVRDLICFLKEAQIDEEKIIVGGIAVRNLKKALLKYINVKYGFIGEGEIDFVSVVDKLGKGESIKTAPGVIYLEKGKYYENKYQLINFSDNFTPDWDVYDERYFNKPNKYGMKATMSIQSKRGCAYNCVYCIVPNLEGNKVRLRDPIDVVDEMEAIAKRFGNIPIDIIDNDFNMPQEHGEAICHEIIKRNGDFDWTCGINPAFVTKDFLVLLKEAKCSRVDVGIETCSIRMMRNLCRPICEHDHLINIAKWCKELDLNSYFACSLCGPGESYFTLKETFDILEKMELESRDGYPTVIFYGGLRVYPETKLAEIAYSEGLIWENHPLLFPVYYISKGMDYSVYNLIKEYKLKHPEWLFKGSGFNVWMKQYEEIDRLKTGRVVTVEESEQKQVETADLIGTKVGDCSFMDLDDKPVTLHSLLDNNVVFVVASQQNNETTRSVFKKLKEIFKDENDCKLQALGSIPALPHFVTKDFIKGQLSLHVDTMGPIILDWESVFINKTLNITIDERVLILGITKDGEFKFVDQFTESAQSIDDVVGEIYSKLLQKEKPQIIKNTPVQEENANKIQGATAMYTNENDIVRDMNIVYGKMMEEAEVQAILKDVGQLIMHIEYTDLSKWVTQRVQDGKVELLLGKVGEPDVVEHIASETFVQIMSGEIEPPEAAMAGKVSFDGDFSKMLQLQPILEPTRKYFNEVTGK